MIGASVAVCLFKGRPHENGALLICLASEAGFGGAMISMVLEDAGTKWIIGKRALGDRWKKQVLDRTARAFGGKDILALVAASGEPEFVKNAQKDNRRQNEVARLGNVRSFYTIPLASRQQSLAGGCLSRTKVSGSYRWISAIYGGQNRCAIQTD